MHPIVQLIVSVALVIMAARMWPPLVYILFAGVLALAAIKLLRRIARLIKLKRNSPVILWLMPFFFSCGMWLALAGIADYFMPKKISAIQIVVCFACAYLFTAFIVWSLQRRRN